MDGSTTTSTVDVLGKWKSEYRNFFCETADGISSYNQVSDLNSGCPLFEDNISILEVKKPLKVLSEVKPEVLIIFVVKYCITILPFIFYTFYLTCPLTKVLSLQYGGNV